MIGMLAAAAVEHSIQHAYWTVTIGGYEFTLMSNHILMQLVAAALIAWFIPRAVAARAGNDPIGRLVPTGLGNAIEAICLFLRNEVFKPNLGKYSDMFTPYLWTLFFFLTSMNLIGLIPLADVVWFDSTHLLGGAATSNVWVTSSLAVVTLILIVYNGLRFHGMDYIKHFFMGPAFIAPLIALLEVGGLFFKTMALAMRLFANMLGGHILLAVLLGFVAMAYQNMGGLGWLSVTAAVIVASVLIYVLKVLVAFLQAFIFVMLTAVFIGMAVNIHHDDHHEDHHGEHEHGHEPAGGAASHA